jgi:hypothetical protein
MARCIVVSIRAVGRIDELGSANELVPNNRQKVRFSAIFRIACARPRLHPPDVVRAWSLLQRAAQLKHLNCGPPVSEIADGCRNSRRNFET